MKTLLDVYYANKPYGKYCAQVEDSESLEIRKYWFNDATIYDILNNADEYAEEYENMVDFCFNKGEVVES